MKMNKGIKTAAIEGIVNGIVIGALVAGVMIFSNATSNTVILRTTIAAMLLRFGTYMVQNSEDVSTGNVGEMFGLPDTERKGRLTFLSRHQLGKLI